MEKTNVMRLLDVANVPYTAHAYDETLTDGVSVANALGQDPERTFKTLVTTDGKKGYFVFVVPVSSTLHLKKAAKAVGAKSIEMIPQRELLPLTGYVHGGCSPIGMKKQFCTVVEETAQLFDTIFFSAGKRGYQVELAPDDFAKLVGAKYEDITE
ncbi:MAG: Cys-tRNA(Pro) deacylase [Clostridia bacterium]|nr:Cys-tRNA(Pro) deacylase [Clostridia bacterium]